MEIPLAAATPAALEQAIIALESKLKGAGPLALELGGTPLRTLDLTDCRVGPALEALKLPAGNDEAHPRRPATLTFTATRQNSALEVQSQAWAVRVSSVAGRPARVVQTGTAVLRAGEDPAAHETALTPPVPAGWRRLATSVTRDGAVPSLKIEVEDEQVFAQLPGGVEDGHYARATRRDEDGVVREIVSGFFIGPAALARALELAPSPERTVRSDIRENAFERRVDFEFVESVRAVSGVPVHSDEAISYNTVRRVIDHPLLASGAPAYRQEIGAPYTEIVQEGSAVGDGRHAAPSTPRYPADLIERRVQYSYPAAELPPERRYVTRWRYLFRTTAAVNGAPLER